MRSTARTIAVEPLCPFPAATPAPTQAPPAGAAPVYSAAQAAMVAAPAGSYPVGDAAGRRSAQPAHEIALTAFAIDRTDVANAAFAEYLNALDLEVRRPFAVTRATRDDFGDEPWPQLLEQGRAEGLYPIIALDDRQVRIGYRAGAFRAKRGYGNHPVAETTWRGARDSSRWRGARLPSEAEWDAARGTAGRTYPPPRRS